MNAVEFQNVTKKYNDLVAVDNVSFHIPQGSITALLGQNGAGKSTSIKMLCGLITSTNGTVLTFGKQPVPYEIGYMPEESAVYEDMGIADYLDYFIRLYDLNINVGRTRVKHILERLKLTYNNKKLGELSKGMKRKVLLARSLVQDPKLLVYDEPASGLDVETSVSILDFLYELSKQKKTVLFSTHHLSHVERIATQVIVIKKGKKIFDDTPLKLKSMLTKNFTISFSAKNGVDQKIIESKQFEKLLNIDNILDVHSQSLEDAYLKLIE